MNTDDAKQTVNRLAENVSDAANRAGMMAHDATHRAGEVAHDAVHRASELAHDAAHVVKKQADRSITASQEYVRENPLPTILGAVAVGLVVGYLISRRDEEAQIRKAAHEPMQAARDAVLSVLSPFADRLHHQYDVAKESADDLYHKINSRKNRRAAQGLMSDARRLGSHLKFW